MRSSWRWRPPARTGTSAASPSTTPSPRPAAGSRSADVCRMVSERLHMLPPFRWRLVEVPFGIDQPYWVEDPAFDLDFHIRERAVPPPGDDRQLAETVARIFARPLDRSRPLWELYLIQGLQGGRVAMLTKLHHSMVDGVSGNEILGVLLDPSPEGKEMPPKPAREPGERVPGDLEMLGRGLLGVPRQPLRALRSLPIGAAEPDRAARRQRVPGRAAAGAACGLARPRRRPDGARGDHRPPAEDELQRPRRAAPPLRVRLALARHGQAPQERARHHGQRRRRRAVRHRACAAGCSSATSCPTSRWWR